MMSKFIKINSKQVIGQISKAIPKLGSGKHKGQSGRIAVLGGCFEYTGAPYVAAICAMKAGADLGFVFCSKDAGTAIKAYGPELIILPVLRTQRESGEEKHPPSHEDIVKLVADWVGRCTGLIVGPGLGRDEQMQKAVHDIIKEARANNIPMVIDADALLLVENDLSLIKGYPLTILTPNVNEFKRLCQKVLGREVSEKDDPHKTIAEVAEKLGNVTIIQKGEKDLISDGSMVIECDQKGSPRRCGGQGDVLAGVTGTFAAWFAKLEFEKRETSKDEPVIPNLMLAAYAGCTLTRDCNYAAFEEKHRSMLAIDMVNVVGKRFHHLFETSETTSL